MTGSCNICLSPFQDPASIPCGHVYCLKCINNCIGRSTDGFVSTCPTCRAEFPVVTPELTCLPQKFHRYITPSIRRVYFDATPEETNLHAKLEEMKDRVKALERDQEILMRNCERHMNNARAHAEGERAARNEIATLRAQNEALEEVVDDSKVEYRGLKQKYDNMKRCYKLEIQKTQEKTKTKHSRDSFAPPRELKKRSNPSDDSLRLDVDSPRPPAIRRRLDVDPPPRFSNVFAEYVASSSSRTSDPNPVAPPKQRLRLLRKPVHPNDADRNLTQNFEDIQRALRARV